MTRTIRLYTEHDLNTNNSVALTKAQAHYLKNVLRRSIGDPIHFFNGRDGEWNGNITELSKTNGIVALNQQTKPQGKQTNIHVFCAPIKKDRLDFCVEKSVELGAASFTPIFTDFTDVKRVNLERMQTNAVEAAQQCRSTNVMEISQAVKFNSLLDQWPEERTLYVCAERGSAPAFQDALKEQKNKSAAILIGPEGGFSDQELEALKKHPQTQFIHLGPLILRTETALTAALTLYQSVQGNWVDYKRD